jgi:exosortase A-associated hydrolase 1
MQPDEQALLFDCAGEALVGILHPVAAPAVRGVLIVVGGPQYRAGSHRQFTLLARQLAAQGIPAMRFDYRGMGDSSGTVRNFEQVQQDLRAAIDQFCQAVPGLREVVLWGLCDAASAAMFYAADDARVRGLVLLNPWARTPDGLARATLKHYYLARLGSAEFWKKVFSGRFAAGAALRSLTGLLRTACGGRAAPAPVATPGEPTPALPAAVPELGPRMLAGLQRFAGPVLLVTCDADLTAQEFLAMAKGSRSWRALLAAPRVQHRTMAAADHTFSRREWRDQVGEWTGNWVKAW